MNKSKKLNKKIDRSISKKGIKQGLEILGFACSILENFFATFLSKGKYEQTWQPN